MIDICDGKLSKVERRKSDSFTVLLCNTILLIKKFNILKGWFVLYFISFLVSENNLDLKLIWFFDN